MSTVKVKELKDDVIVNVPVNKSYYLMVKAVLYDLFSKLIEKGANEESIQGMLKKEYNELTQDERSFYTVTLLLAEIEKQAIENNLFEEKEFDAEKVVDNHEPKD